MGVRRDFCVPAIPGFKEKEDVVSKIARLANNSRVPSVIPAVFLEASRRFLNGQSAGTTLESDLFPILDGLSPDVKNVLRCCINNVRLTPRSQRDAIFSPEITADTLLTYENISSLLVTEFLKRASFKIFGDENALTNPRPGFIRRERGGTPEFPFDDISPEIFAINDIRTFFAITEPGALPLKLEETERTCSINEQGQRICLPQMGNCPGRSVGNNTCLLVHQLVPGSQVKLKGLNFFTTNAKVVLSPTLQPQVQRVVPTIVYGDQDTPVRDEQGNLIRDTRVNDLLIFTIPEDLSDGLYTIRVQVENTDPSQGPVGIHTSLEEFLRILPPPTTNFLVLADQLRCVEETKGPGSDEVGLTFLTTLLINNPLSPLGFDPSPLTRQEFIFEGVDSGENRSLNFSLVQANNLAGVAISVLGFEIDDEDFYRDQITEFGEAYKVALETIWVKTIGSVASGAAGAIAAAAGATFAVGTIIVAAVGLIVTAAAAAFYAAWAPADLIIDDSIALTLTDLATLTNSFTPPREPSFTITNREILVIVEALSAGAFTYDELRGYNSPAPNEASLYQITFKYSRF